MKDEIDVSIESLKRKGDSGFLLERLDKENQSVKRDSKSRVRAKHKEIKMHKLQSNFVQPRSRTVQFSCSLVKGESKIQSKGLHVSNIFKQNIKWRTFSCFAFYGSSSANFRDFVLV